MTSAPDSARLLTRACIYLKINQMKLLMKIVKSSLNEIDILGTRQETRAIVGGHLWGWYKRF